MNDRIGCYDKVRLLEQIAQAWNDSGINYAVAHGLERYPGKVGRDLDVFVRDNEEKALLNIAEEVLRENQLRIAYPPPLWGARLVAVGRKGWFDMIEIHTMKRLSWRNIVFAACPEASEQKGVFKIDPWASFVKRIFMPILSGDFSRFISRPKELELSDEELNIIKARLPLFCGQKLGDQLVKAVQSKDLQDFGRLRRDLERYLFWHNLGKAHNLPETIHKVWRRFVKPFYPCAPIIAFVGPDGVGKSTLMSYLSHGETAIFTKIVIRHWRPSLVPQLGSIIGKKAINPDQNGLNVPRRVAGHLYWLRIFYYFLDYLSGHFLKDNVDSCHQRLVLYDRCYLDMMVDPVRYGLSSTRGMQLLWQLLPKLDLVILIYDDPDRIRYRKPELPKEEIKRQLKEWLNLADEGKVNAVIRVDAPPEEIAQRVKALIVEAFIEKNRGLIPERIR